MFRRTVKDQKIWCADITNPEDRSRTRMSLRENFGITTADQAYEWAKDKARELEERRKAVTKGALHKSAASTTIDQMVADYFKAHKGDLAPRTYEHREKYFLPQLTMWAKEAKVRYCRDLDRKTLVDFRTALQSKKKFKVEAGGNRKTPNLIATKASRTAVSLNSILREIKAVLNWGRKSGYLHLDSDAIKESLAPFKQHKKQKRWLKQEEIQALVHAAKELDGETMSVTRESKAAGIKWEGELPPKYEPVLPTLLLLLLGGFRKAELENLRWDDVDFKNGTITVGFNEDSGWRPKTSEERYITLKESPLLAELLKKMRKERGGAKYVLGGDKPKTLQRNAWRRLLAKAELPDIKIKDCRSTCATYLICSPTFGGVPYLVASRMGHSVDTLFKHYAGLIRSLKGKPTLEAEMGIAAAAASSVEGEQELSD